jgi:hypothetical protein
MSEPQKIGATIRGNGSPLHERRQLVEGGFGDQADGINLGAIRSAVPLVSQIF